MADSVTAPGASRALVDNHGRRITYLRLAITDRCNLRCRYCMPEQGAEFVPHDEILTFEEMIRLLGILAPLGVNKVRVTGGEPFVRRGSVAFMGEIKKVPGVSRLYLTTNGVAVAEHLEALQAIGVDGLNLSLDTLDGQRFQYLCRRDLFSRVWDTFTRALARGIPVKVNAVVQEDTNDADILAMAGLADQYGVTVRFIEKMAFSGRDSGSGSEFGRLADRLFALFPRMVEVVDAGPATARLFYVPGRQGLIGLIEGYSRRFCAGCNKIRITPIGILKACLYDNGVLDLKAMLRGGADDVGIEAAIRAAIGRRFVDGMETESRVHRQIEPSMATIGG